jgi:8-oxo-dGTP pyrophosphatase MutT (NUDIX family)
MKEIQQRKRGVVAVIPRASRLLVIRRSRFVIAPGAYCFPGGGIEAGEDALSALLRECREEVGVDCQPRREIWTSITPRNVELSWWLAELAPDARLTPNAQEVESLHWFTPTDMRALSELLESNHHFLDAWQRGDFELPLPG